MEKAESNDSCRKIVSADFSPHVPESRFNVTWDTIILTYDLLEKALREKLSSVNRHMAYMTMEKRIIIKLQIIFGSGFDAQYI